MSGGGLLLSRIMKTETQIPDVSGKLNNVLLKVLLSLCFCAFLVKKTSMCSNIQLKQLAPNQKEMFSSVCDLIEGKD